LSGIQAVGALLHGNYFGVMRPLPSFNTKARRIYPELQSRPWVTVTSRRQLERRISGGLKKCDGGVATTLRRRGVAATHAGLLRNSGLFHRGLEMHTTTRVSQSATMAVKLAMKALLFDFWR
jgi:hypothetical protein